MNTPAPPPGRISLFSATSLVVANMIGTGVFTSLGLQAEQFRSPGILIMIWILGGLFALSGALCYGELAAALPRSGGEYHFLSQIYHPGIGFTAGWISVIVGFAAPLALAAMAFGKYFQATFQGSSSLVASIAVVLVTTMAHLFSTNIGAWFQNGFTTLKLIVIIGFILSGLLLGSVQPVSLVPTSSDLAHAVGGPFAVCLIYVMYAYSGWNASVYIAQEVAEPERNLPRSLLIGTLVVTVLYVGLNSVFLLTTPIGQLAGQIDIGAISATHIFGPVGGRLISGLISVALVSCISAMTWAGPRIWQVMGEDCPLLSDLAKKSPAGVPVVSSILQMSIVTVLLISSTFEAILIYAQFTLNLCAFLTVLGVFVLRWTQPNLPRPYKVWGYPFPPLAFLLISGSTTGYLISTKPAESFIGFCTIATGYLFYLASPRVPDSISDSPKSKGEKC